MAKTGRAECPRYPTEKARRKRADSRPGTRPHALCRFASDGYPPNFCVPRACFATQRCRR
eukprot:5761183-Lingulodinium_polyedra.AAC.1